jgi:hypothetical protein
VDHLRARLDRIRKRRLQFRERWESETLRPRRNDWTIPGDPEITRSAKAHVAIEQPAHPMERQHDEQILRSIVQAIPADLTEIKIEVKCDGVRRELVTSEGDVSKMVLCVAMDLSGVNMIILYTPGSRYANASRFHEGRQRARHTKPAARQILLRKKDPVNQASRVVTKQRTCE